MKAQSKAQRKAKQPMHWAVRIVLLVAGALIFVKGVQLSMQIRAKQDVYDDLQEQIAVMQVYNEDLAEKIADPEEYLKQRVREADYVYPNDQVYQFTN